MGKSSSISQGYEITAQLSFSIAAGASKALQLDEARSAASGAERRQNENVPDFFESGTFR